MLCNFPASDWKNADQTPNAENWDDFIKYANACAYGRVHAGVYLTGLHLRLDYHLSKDGRLFPSDSLSLWVGAVSHL